MSLSINQNSRIVAPTACPACGDALPPAAQFCPGCGRSVQPLKGVGTDSVIGPRTDKPLSVIMKMSPETKNDIGELALFLPPRYQPLKKVGQGGMGTVYQCLDQALERPVAIKIMTERYQSDPQGERRFMREARAQAIVNHPNVATVLNFGVTPEGRLFLVIEYIEGEDLRSIIRRDKIIEPLRALDWLRQTCEGLHEAHSAGLVHRDLKPSNVMITKDHRGGDWIKILDLGLAKIVGGQSDLRSITMDTAGMLIGTPAYMSPEQVAGSTVDGRADIYSLGVVFFEMITGHLPFESETMEGWLYKHLHVKPPPASKINPDLAKYPQLDHIVMWMMSKEPHERPSSAGELAAMARRLIDSKIAPDTLLRPQQQPRRSRNTKTFEENPPARKSGPRRAMNFDDMPLPPPDQERVEQPQGPYSHLLQQTMDPPTSDETRERRREEYELLANEAEAAMAERRYEAALDMWNKALDISSDNAEQVKKHIEFCRVEIEVDINLQQAHSFAEAGDWQKAEQILNKLSGYRHTRVEQAKARLHRQLMTSWLQLAQGRVQALPEGDLRQALMERLSFAHAQAGDMPGAMIIMQDATRKPLARVIGLSQALIASINMGNREGLRPYLDRLNASATALDDPSERGRALLEAGHALTAYGDQSAAATSFQSALGAFSEANTKGIPIQVPKRGGTGILRKGSPDTLRSMTLTATSINSVKSAKALWEAAIGTVAQAQAEAGLVDDSLASAALIEDPWTLAHSLSQVAQALAKTGRSAEADKVASKITFAMPKTQAMRALAVARVYRSDMTGAEEILRTIPTPGDRIALQGLLAAAWALRHEKGRAQVCLEEVMKLVPEVVGAKARFVALTTAIEPLLNAGYTELSDPLVHEAEKLIDLIDDPAERLRSLIHLIKLQENARNDRLATTRTVIFSSHTNPVVLELLRKAMVVWRQVRKGPERFECTEMLAHCVARASAPLLASEMLAASKDDTENAMMFIGFCTGVA